MCLKMVYRELDVVMKTVSCKVITIAKYKLISHVCVHFIWWGGYLNMNTSSEHINCYLMSMWASLHWPEGVYLNVNTSSEHTNCYLMSMWTSLHWPEGVYLNLYSSFICDIHVHFLFLTSYGGISDIRIYFIWIVYCHYLHYELLNTEQCRLLYVVVIVVTIAYSYCYF